jgi:hypothetical protein
MWLIDDRKGDLGDSSKCVLVKSKEKREDVTGNGFVGLSLTRSAALIEVFCFGPGRKFIPVERGITLYFFHLVDYAANKISNIQV